MPFKTINVLANFANEFKTNIKPKAPKAIFKMPTLSFKNITALPALTTAPANASPTCFANASSPSWLSSKNLLRSPNSPFNASKNSSFTVVWWDCP